MHVLICFAKSEAKEFVKRGSRIVGQRIIINSKSARRGQRREREIIMG